MGDRKAPTPIPVGAVKPDPPPAPPRKLDLPATIIANDTLIMIENAAGGAVHLTVVGVDGGRPIVDVTIRGGPSGDGGV